MGTHGSDPRTSVTLWQTDSHLLGYQLTYNVIFTSLSNCLNIIHTLIHGAMMALNYMTT